MKNLLRFTLAVHIVLFCTLNTSFAQRNHVGIFDGHRDVGSNVKPGAATFIKSMDQYVISGSGTNIWGNHDEFHYLWKKMSGDFVLHARARFVGEKGVEEHRKIGWMIRKNLEANAAHVNAVVHGDGLTSLQYRRSAGAETEERKSTITHATFIDLQREGKKYIMRVSTDGKEYASEEIEDVDLGNDVYAGLFVGSHNPSVIETAVFDEVTITGH